MRTMRNGWLTLAVVALALTLGPGRAAADELRHVKANLIPVTGSSVKGHVSLVEMPHGGTLISIVATGLRPDGSYVSLYYDNHVCEIEPYSEDDVIGTYSGNRAGIGTTVAKVDDDLDEINSISVRNAEDFSLLACANVH